MYGWLFMDGCWLNGVIEYGVGLDVSLSCVHTLLVLFVWFSIKVVISVQNLVKNIHSHIHQT